MRLHVGARNLGAEDERPRIARHREIHEPRLDDRVDDHDLAATAADHHERAHHPRVVARRVAADEHDKVGVFHVVELHGAGARAHHARQPHAARLVAVVAAVVDVIRAIDPREELEQEASLVARAAAEVPERFVRVGPQELRGDPLHRVGPGDRLVVLRALLEHHRLHEPARVLHLVGSEGLQLRDRVGLEECRLHRPLHVGDHRLERLLADLGEVAGLVDHPAGLPTHAERAGLAGVLRTHGLPEFPEAARFAGFLERVHDRAKAAAGRHLAEESSHSCCSGPSPNRSPVVCFRNGTCVRLEVSS